jgi:hypothetical protein
MCCREGCLGQLQGCWVGKARWVGFSSMMLALQYASQTRMLLQWRSWHWRSLPLAPCLVTLLHPLLFARVLCRAGLVGAC